MMIGPDTFYEYELKGKSATQIMDTIKELKREIKQLKDIMEHPDYCPTTKPSEDVRLFCTREYLERAKQALVEAGGTYRPSKLELQAEEFNANIPYISKVEFSMSGFAEGHKTKTYIVENDGVQIYTQHSLAPKNSNANETETMNTGDFLEKIKHLHIGEWRKKYDTERFGIMIYDGTQWSLVIQFSNGYKTVKIQGDNAYPYNFDRALHAFNAT